MLKRKDGKRLPLWIVPNGSGNLVARGFMIQNTEHALGALSKGHVIKIDVIKTLIDYESEADIRKAGAKVNKHLLYSLEGSAYGLISEAIGETSNLMKQLIGSFAYFLNIFKGIIRGRRWRFDIDLDDGKTLIKN